MSRFLFFPLADERHSLLYVLVVLFGAPLSLLPRVALYSVLVGPLELLDEFLYGWRWHAGRRRRLGPYGRRSRRSRTRPMPRVCHRCRRRPMAGRVDLPRYLWSLPVLLREGHLQHVLVAGRQAQLQRVHGAHGRVLALSRPLHQRCSRRARIARPPLSRCVCHVLVVQQAAPDAGRACL